MSLVEMMISVFLGPVQFSVPGKMDTGRRVRQGECGKRSWMNGNAEKSNGNVWLTGEDFIVAVAHGDYFQTNLSYAAAVQIDTVRGR